MANRFPELLPSLGMLLFCVYLLYTQAITASINPTIYIWSGLRLAFLFSLAMISLYFILSIFCLQLLSLNNYLLVSILIALVLTEITIRVVPGILPDNMMAYLKPSDTKCTNYVPASGNRMLYHYPPHAQLPGRPYVKIDRNGFRNSEELRPVLDLVLLGDSMLISRDSEIDMGEKMRRTGLSVYNLGMGGYSACHCRDAYRQYIIDGKVKHQLTVVFITMVNDFSDGIRYRRVLASNGDYANYLGRMRRSAYVPVAFQLIGSLPGHILTYFRGKYTVQLPCKSITTKIVYPPWKIVADSESWGITEEAIAEIHSDARKSGSKLVIALVPSPLSIYAAYDRRLLKYKHMHDVTSHTIADYCRKNSIYYFDPLDELTIASRHDFLFIEDSDCHFNTAGVEVFSKIVHGYLMNQHLLPDTE